MLLGSSRPSSFYSQHSRANTAARLSPLQGWVSYLFQREATTFRPSNFFAHLSACCLAARTLHLPGFCSCPPFATTRMSSKPSPSSVTAPVQEAPSSRRVYCRIERFIGSSLTLTRASGGRYGRPRGQGCSRKGDCSWWSPPVRRR